MTIKDEICPQVNADVRLCDDGTLWIKTEKLDKVGRVIVEHGTSCKQFYQDAKPEQRTGVWVPVTERLPEDDTVVLVCGKSGGVYTAIHNNSKTWIRGWWKMNSKNHHCNPTAWMPLPKAYKNEGSDE